MFEISWSKPFKLGVGGVTSQDSSGSEELKNKLCTAGMAYVSKVLIDWQLVEESFGQLIAIYLIYFPPSNLLYAGYHKNCSIFDLLGFAITKFMVYEHYLYLVLEISNPLSSRLSKLPRLNSFALGV